MRKEEETKGQELRVVEMLGARMGWGGGGELGWCWLFFFQGQTQLVGLT